MKPPKDYIFLNTINKLFTEEEILEIIYFLEQPDISKPQKDKIEQFFIKLNNTIKDWSETLLNFCNSYGVDVELILSQAEFIKKIKAETKKSDDRLTSFFI